MKITRGNEQLGTAIPRQATIDASVRTAYGRQVDLTSVALNSVAQVSEVMIGLRRAEEDAKISELQAQYEMEFTDSLHKLDKEHEQNNLSSEVYGQRYNQMVTDLQGKYGSAYDFSTEYKQKFQQFLDLDRNKKQREGLRKVETIALQNQQVAWARTEAGNSTIAVSGDYQQLQDTITQQNALYDSPAYLVANGQKAIDDKVKFTDRATHQWAVRNLLAGSDPYEMLANLQAGTMFGNVSGNTRNSIEIDINQEIARREAAAKAAAKADKKEESAAEHAYRIQQRMGMDPENKNDVAGFKYMQEQTAAMYTDPQEQFAALERNRLEYRYIEKDVASDLRGRFNSSDPVMRSLALQKAAYYISEEPELAQYLADDLVDAANFYLSGHTEMEAIELMTSLKNQTKEQKASFKESFKSVDRESFQETAMAAFERKWDVDDTGITDFSEWARPTELERVAADKFELFYAAIGNEDVAARKTEQFLLKNYGVTNIGGDQRFMFKPPVLFFRQRQPNMKIEPTEIRDLFVDELKAARISETVALQSTITYAGLDNVRKMPRYVVTTPNGVLYNSDGTPRYWTFDAGMVKVRMDQRIETEKKDKELAKQRARLELEKTINLAP